MDKIVTIAKTQVKTDKTGKTFLSVLAKDSSSYAIYQQGLWNFMQENLAVKLIGEQKGKYFNVEDAQSIAQALDERPPMIIEQPAKLDREASIESQVAIKEIGENWRTGKFSDKDKEVETYRLWLIDRLNKTFYGGQGVKQYTRIPMDRDDAMPPSPLDEPRDTGGDDTGGTPITDSPEEWKEWFEEAHQKVKISTTYLKSLGLPPYTSGGLTNYVKKLSPQDRNLLFTDLGNSIKQDNIGE